MLWTMDAECHHGHWLPGYLTFISNVHWGPVETLGSALGSSQKDRGGERKGDLPTALPCSEATYLVGVQGDPVGS